MSISPADIRNAALLSVATLAAGFVVPVFPYVGLPLAAFALGWLTYRFGTAPTAILAVACAGLVAALGPAVIGTNPLDGLFVGVALLGLGPVAALALKKYPALNVAAGVTAAITLAYLAAPIGAQTLADAIVASKQIWTAVVAGSAVSDPAALKAAMTAYLAQIPATWPAASFYTMGIGTAVGISLIGRAGRSLGQDVHRYGPLADIDVSFHIVWPTILGLACAAAGSLWSQAPDLVGAVGANALMIVRPFLFLQGAAVFAALYRKAGAGRFARTSGFVLLALMEVFIPVVSILGVVDLFLNLRKAPRGGSVATGVAM